MAGELWGVTAGARLARDDQSRWAVQDAQRLAQLAQIPLHEAQARHQDALSRLNDAQAETIRSKDRRESETAGAYREALSRLTSGGPAPAEGDRQQAILGGLGEALLAKGDLDGAAKLIKASRELAESQSRIAENTAQTVGHTAKAQRQAHERLAQMLSGVKGPQDLAAVQMQWEANPTLSALAPEAKELFRQYDPNRIRAFVNGTKAYYDAQENRRDDAATAALVNVRNASASASAARAAASKLAGKYVEERTKRLKDTQTNRAKTGAYPKVQPADVLTVSSVVKGMGGELEADALDTFAREVVYEAELAVKQNPALNKAEVIRGLVEREKREGNLVLPEPSMNPFASKKASISRPEDRAEPIPADPRQAKPGALYISEDGGIVRFERIEHNGRPALKRVQVRPPAPMAPRMRNPLDEEDEE